MNLFGKNFCTLCNEQYRGTYLVHEVEKHGRCQTCNKEICLEKYNAHLESDHSIRIYITYTGVAQSVLLMYEDGRSKQMLPNHSPNGFFYLVSLVDSKDYFTFSFLIDGCVSKVANNYPVTNEGDKKVNKVGISKNSNGPIRLQCCGFSFQSRVAHESCQFSRNLGVAKWPSTSIFMCIEAMQHILFDEMNEINKEAINLILKDAANNIKYIQKNLKNTKDSKYLKDEIIEPEIVLEVSGEAYNMLKYLGWLHGESRSDFFDAVKSLKSFVDEVNISIGAILTTRKTAVALTYSQDGRILMFDPQNKVYSDEKPSGASIFLFKDLDELITFLNEIFPMVEGKPYSFHAYKLSAFVLADSKASSDIINTAASRLFKSVTTKRPSLQNNEDTASKAYHKRFQSLGGDLMKEGKVEMGNKSWRPPVGVEMEKSKNYYLGVKLNRLAEAVEDMWQSRYLILKSLDESLDERMDYPKMEYRAKIDLLGIMISQVRIALENLYQCIYLKNRENFHMLKITLSEAIRVMTENLKYINYNQYMDIERNELESMIMYADCIQKNFDDFGNILMSDNNGILPRSKSLAGFDKTKLERTVTANYCYNNTHFVSPRAAIPTGNVFIKSSKLSIFKDSNNDILSILRCERGLWDEYKKLSFLFKPFTPALACRTCHTHILDNLSALLIHDQSSTASLGMPLLNPSTLSSVLSVDTASKGISCKKCNAVLGELRDLTVPETGSQEKVYIYVALEKDKAREFRDCAFLNGKMLALVHAGSKRILSVQTESEDKGSMFDCSICLERHPENEAFILEFCKHKICKESAKKLIKNELRMGNLPLTCPICKMKPCAQCPSVTLLPEDIKCHEDRNELSCVISERDLEKILNEQELKAYRDAVEDKMILKSKGRYVRCPAEGCRHINMREPDSGALCVCSSCGYGWCCNCHVEWHVKQTCAQYSMAAQSPVDEDLEKLKNSGNFKKCPNCKHWGEKENQSQCNAITCLHCNGTFCWVCQKSLSHLTDPHHHFAEPSDCYGKCFEGLEWYEDGIET